MSQRLGFMVGFGLLGVLPLLQLVVLWHYCDGETVGRTLFAATIALFMSAFCDGTSSYKSRTAGEQTEPRRYLLNVLRIRLSRFSFAAPLGVAALVLFGKPIADAVAAALLSCAYLLAFAFVERNFGSVGLALRQEYLSRLTCLLFPAAGVVAIGAPGGLVAGCAAALVVQTVALALHSRPRFHELRPSTGAAFSHDLLSGLLSLVYVSFSQLTMAALLTPLAFAQFITIDRIVRSGLLITEPARLLYLRRSWLPETRLSMFHILGTGVLIAAAATAAVGLLFVLDVPRRLLRVDQQPSIYLLVCLLTSLVSFTTLCGFIRFEALRTVNTLLGFGLLAGAVAFAYSFPSGPFTSALAFETMVCIIVVAGAVATNFGRGTEPSRTR